MSIYIIIVMLLLTVGAIITLFIQNRVMAKELAKLQARLIPLELERDRQIRMGVLK